MSGSLPMDAGGCILAGRRCLQEGRIDDAIGLFQDALHMDAHSAEAAQMLGVAFSRKGNFDEGVRYLQDAARMLPDSVDVRFNLAVALDRSGRTPEAIAELERAAQMDPANDKVSRALASLRSRAAAPAQAPGPYGQPQGQPSQPQRVDLAGNPIAGGGGGPAPAHPMTDLAGNPLPTQSAQAFPGSGGPGPAAYPAPGQQQGYQPPQPGHQPPPPPPGVAGGYGRPAPPAGGPYATTYNAMPGGAQPGVGDDPGKFSIEAVKRIITDPTGFGRDNLGWTDLGAPLVFLVILLAVQMVIMAVGAGIGLATGGAANANSGAIAGTGTQTQLASMMGVSGAVGIAAMVVLGIPFGIIGEFIGVGITHLFVMMFGGRRGYNATFRAMVYASVPGVFIAPIGLLTAVLPALAPVQMIASIIVGIWSLVLTIIFLREMQAITTGGAVGAIFLPGIVCCALVAAILFPVFTMARERARQQMGGPGFGTGSPFGSRPGFGGPSAMPAPPSFGGPGGQRGTQF
jgi:hypothetical protein